MASQDRRNSGIGDADKPQTQRFRRVQTGPRLAPESAERQSRIALMAWELLGPDAAIAFLNGHNDDLGARPLDLAIASTAGFEAVERAIGERVEARSSGQDDH